ncbi:tRNA lysidine(34) synthetase TilS [Luteimonas sp. TWI1437]|uniref:tRNA lysidine(34) synthetase TilS n=1 Tax=unclassified Luteimonas TaxID=2629088 RepID=UPI00320B7D5B
MSAPFPDPTLPAPPGDGPLHVAFSGGLDSTALLHLLAHDARARVRGLVALHVHHGLQPQADAWAAHCEAVCAALGVRCEVLRVTVARDGDRGLEAAAREARHAALQARLPPGAVAVLAHHRDDQAETVLLRALRGAGPDGLAAMRPLRPFGAGWLWRPLLAVARAQLLAYAMRHGLHWIEDPSNAADDADRNFLRNRVLPLLRTRWPQADAVLTDVATLQRTTIALLDDEDTAALAKVRTSDPAMLDVARLRTLPTARRARVLRRWIAALGLPPLPRQGSAWCEATLQMPAGDRSPQFDWAHCRLQRWRDLLHAGPQRTPLPREFAVDWAGTAPLVLPGGDRLHLHGPPPDAPLDWQVRARRGGERIALPGRTHSHALKHVLQDRAVPPWLRERLPLLIDASGRVLAAGDLVLDGAFEAWLRDGGRRLRWAHDAAVHDTPAETPSP